MRIQADTVVDGRYQVIAHLGSGGMAEVYCATDLQLGRKVALKLLHDRFERDAEFVERFKREASAAAGLQHQHVVSVYDRGEWDGTSYIAMEYVAGRTLKQVIRETDPPTPLPPARAVDLAIQILRATRFAHRRGVIHRDLKPHNVIVDEEGRAKVTDFGIARQGASDMTQTGSIMGTAQYLSPEQAQGHAVTARSDLYAVGIVLYEMLTGGVPFEADSAVTIAVKQVNEAPVPPSAINPEVTPELEAVVLCALQKDPAARFADADEFIAAHEAARAGHEVLPPPPVVEEVVEEDRGRRWWLWLLILLALAAIALGLY
ncbi:MAG: protein kinase domain-containing protein, partial [Solirubrobacteraceae bacterium]